MRDKSSLLFKLKLFMIWTKGAHQSAKSQTFDCSHEISPNLFFDSLLLLKIYKISAETAQKSYVSWHWRVMHKIWRKTDFWFRKWHEIFSECWDFDGIFFSKIENTWAKTLQNILCILTLKRVVSNVTWGIWQILT